MDVTTWYLEQTSPDDLLQGRPPGVPVDVVRAEIPSPEFSRFLYTAVGGDWQWTSRLPWTWRQWTEFLDRPGTETWVAWRQGTPAGYVELVAQDSGVVEIASFGLLPSAIGLGLGGHLLSFGTARAWDLAERWPDLPAESRPSRGALRLSGAPSALAGSRRPESVGIGPIEFALKQSGRR